MNSKNLLGATLVALLLAGGVAQAGDDGAHDIVNQNLSKRPYQAPANDATANKADQWDGATLVKEEAAEDKTRPNQYQQLRIRMLGQRPYMDGN